MEIPVMLSMRGAALVAIVLAGCAGTPSPSPLPSASSPSTFTSGPSSPPTAPPAPPTPTARPAWVTRSVATGAIRAVILDGPLAAAAVVVPGPGEGDPAQAHIVRVDMPTGATSTAGPFSGATSLTLAGDALWLAGAPAPGVADSDARALVALDPVTLAQRKHIELPAAQGDRAHALTGTSTDLWVTNGATVLDFDPSTARVKRTLAVPNGEAAVTIALDPGGAHLYVATSNPDMETHHLVEWATASGTLVVSTYLNTIAPGTMAATTAGVWAAEPTGMLGSITFFTSPTLSPRAPAEPVTLDERLTNGVSVAFGDGVLWVGDGMAERLVCADPVTGERRAETSPLLISGPVAVGSTMIAAAGADGLDILQPPPACFR